MTPDYPLMINQLKNEGLSLTKMEERTGVGRFILSGLKTESTSIPEKWQHLDIDDDLIKAVSLCILYKLTFNNRVLPDLHKPWD